MRFVNQFFQAPKDDLIYMLPGSTGSGLKYNSGAYCPITDRIYLAPWNAPQICEIDPNLDTWQMVGSSFTGAEMFSGFVYVGGGKMIGIPLSYSQAIIFDTVTKVWTPIGTSYPALLKWYGGALANNGFVYAAPFNGASQFLKIDPIGLTTTLVGSSIGTSFRLSGMAQIGSNLFLAANRNHTHPVIFDANTDTWTNLGSSQGTSLNKYWSSHAMPGGYSYLVKCNAALHGKVENVTSTLSFFGVSESSINRFYGMGLAPNGFLYTTPATFNYIEKLDPVSNNRKLIAIPLTGSEKFLGSPILAPNGAFYFPAANSTQIMKLINIGIPSPSMFTFPASLTDFHLTDWNIYQNRY
jgi:hypothetical protein